MINNKVLLILIVMAFGISLTACSKTKHKGMTFEITGENTVKVLKISDKNKPKDKLVIPEKVELDGKIYTVTAIDSWGFFGCKDITEVVIPNTITDIGNWAFTNCEKLSKIDIPDTVTHLGYAALEDCKSLTSITIPKSITQIEERLFQHCDNLKQINLPETITCIGMSAISGCKSLESIDLPNAVTAIEPYALAYNDNLKHVGLPASLKSIGHDAFSCCHSLTSMDIPEGVTSLGHNAFNYCKTLESITLPSTLSDLDGNPFSSCKELNNITVRPGKNSLVSVDGILFSHDMKQLIICPTTKDCGNYVVPASVKEIMPYAFYDCSKLTGLKMTAVERIGESAFHSTGVSNIDFGTKLKSIEKGAFYSCRNITEVSLPDSVQHLAICIFDFCSSLKTISMSETLVKNNDVFNNVIFNFLPEDIKFISRKNDGTTETLTIDNLYDAKKELFHER